MKTKILASTLLSIGVILGLTAILPLNLVFGGPATVPHTRYRLIDLGTLGGPNSYFNGAPPAMINNSAVAAGAADTSSACSLPDPFSDGFVYPGFKWQNGELINLGLLPGGCWSLPNAINEHGMIDPLTALPEIHADLFYNGQVVDMGTLGGAFSLANDVNNRGQATGFAENTDPDPFAGWFFPGATAYHAFIWQNGVMTDLGTLGGLESYGIIINDSGQVTGLSFTSDVAGPTGLPPVDPFLWTAGTMIDLGTLGGTFGLGNSVNNRGQVVGFSDLAGDLANHAFIWQRGALTDIGTLGGDNSSANWINERGEVVGTADLADGSHHAFVWSNGRMTDLGTIGGDPCSNGFYINSKGQAIGNTTNCHGTMLHAFLWDHGSLVDLNAEVLPGSGFVSVEPVVISDTGWITGLGLLENGDIHAVILQPHAVISTAGQTQVRSLQNQSPAVPPRWSTSNTTRFERRSSTPLERVRSQMRYYFNFPGHPPSNTD
jgi:probable HAF family extracellular repeat protein